MDTFVDSSWYFLRYTDPHNDEEIFEPQKAAYWMPLDRYIGGVEHAILHLLYARFITRFLHDLGLSPVQEPFQGMFTQGMLVRDGHKMSKSKGNVVAPDVYYGDYGADALRLFELFVGPPTDDAVWNDSGVPGTKRFLDRLWRVITETEPEGTEPHPDLIADMHRTIEKVTSDIENLSFNTSVPALMTLTNHLIEAVRGGIDRITFDQVTEALIKLLSPMAPHIAHELWERTGHDTMLAVESWPEWDPDLAAYERVTMVVQVNGKVRDRIEVASDISPEEAEALALGLDRIREWLDGSEVRRVITRPPNLVNVVVG
jgi:leucyl-tRNA synthetase